MSSIGSLWLISLGIAGTALLIMISLLLGRLVLGWTGRAREAERQRIVPLLIKSDAQGWTVRRQDLLADVTIELIQMVRGSDRERFIKTATRMGVPERLRRQLRSGSARLRMTAAEALAEFSDERSVEALCAALRDKHSDVRLTAALSLAALRRAPSPHELVHLLQIGTKENSLLAVALFRDIAEQRPDGVKALILDPRVPAGAKAAAIEALTASADYSLVPVIATLAYTADPADPALPRYLRALGIFGHPAAETAVRRCLGGSSPDVRAAAAEAAGRIGLVSLAPHLRSLLADPEWWVRFRSAEALTRLGAEGVRLLRNAAQAAPGPAQKAAALTLAERGLA